MGNVLNDRHIWNSEVIMSVAGGNKNLGISPPWALECHSTTDHTFTNGAITLFLSKNQEILVETDFAIPVLLCVKSNLTVKFKGL